MLTAAVGHAAPPVDAAREPFGDWVGTLKTDAGTCPDQISSTLQVSRTSVVFTPGDSALVLRGAHHPDGSVHAELVLPDRNHKPLPMVFEGHPDGASFAGVFGTPTCRAHVTLTRPAP
ncbi:hypothetical protein AA103196_0857 [Ameyamaea chiangmaiensis NBRC 103196]|uniref:Uncharacterized protein n=1 Tax=Ameyamaea chiangmaiensis TaxID=442969 RepID=A0A850P4I3_9PROT|nr:hypothetical protein [Ameyamaea chiangmaiensis]MBS4076160.1 hypothetical protein [Ameyamaea chiangmaiensis]NVN39547.1 hypothetical protein [Ameyamaea chiangmaiensis]GBQ64408.1 hypothetical protein AA103196_0857 [Ameyamaea chiangmaiensis NBRC 103196]